MASDLGLNVLLWPGPKVIKRFFHADHEISLGF